MNAEMSQAEVFLTKRYSVLLCHLIIAIDEHVKDFTLEELYSVWVRSRPSRSAFVSLINELEKLGWISKRLETKRSTRNLDVNQDVMRRALLISPQQDMSSRWLFDRGVFDEKMLFANQQ